MEYEKEKTRRGFVRSLFRNGLLAGLGALTAQQWTRRKRSAGRQTCLDPTGRIGCRDCGVFADCRLPEAKSLRQLKTRKPNG